MAVASKSKTLYLNKQYIKSSALALFFLGSSLIINHFAADYATKIASIPRFRKALDERVHQHYRTSGYVSVMCLDVVNFRRYWDVLTKRIACDGFNDVAQRAVNMMDDYAFVAMVPGSDKMLFLSNYYNICQS